MSLGGRKRDHLSLVSHYLPEAPFPNTITLVIRALTCEFWGDTNIQSRAPICNSIFSRQNILQTLISNIIFKSEDSGTRVSVFKSQLCLLPAIDIGHMKIKQDRICQALRLVLGIE